MEEQIDRLMIVQGLQDTPNSLLLVAERKAHKIQLDQNRKQFFITSPLLIGLKIIMNKFAFFSLLVGQYAAASDVVYNELNGTC